MPLWQRQEVQEMLCAALVMGSWCVCDDGHGHGLAGGALIALPGMYGAGHGRVCLCLADD